MFDLLRSQFNKRINLTDEEFSRCTKFFVPKKIRKKHFLLQEGDVCKFITFVNHGCLRAYTIDKKGEEHIIQFAIEDWWISDANSFLTQKPAIYNIDALEDSELLLLFKEDRERLLTEIPKFERFFRLLQEANYVATHKRINATLSESAEERYLEFISDYPALVQRVQQKHIASYLGITPEALSRIRKQLAKKK